MIRYFLPCCVTATPSSIFIRESKRFVFRKDRFVPVAPALAERLRAYAMSLPDSGEDAYFFLAPDRGPYHRSTLYKIFRVLLHRCGIPHGGRGRGPRIHDLRATFAVHRLETWYRNGDDLNVKLPILATYLGHDSLAGTQWYLRLTPHLFPDITKGMEALFGNIVPSARQP